MTLFQRLSMWSLRALLLWGAVEVGGVLYQTMSARAASFVQLQGHDAAMDRLKARADRAEADARAALGRRDALSGAAWRVIANENETLSRAASKSLRETLIELGAQAPVVEAQGGDAGASSRVSLAATWRENVETSPQVLSALSQRHPEFAIERLSLQRGDVVRAELVVSAPVTRVAPR
jgi:hypothetical protein